MLKWHHSFLTSKGRVTHRVNLDAILSMLESIIKTLEGKLISSY